MQIPVIIEPVPNNGYRAKTGEPLPLTAEGTNRDQALANLKQALQGRLQNGVELLALDIDAKAEENPWVKYAGMFKDDPMFDEVVQIMAEQRRRDNEDPDYP